MRPILSLPKQPPPPLSKDEFGKGPSSTVAERTLGE